jgi:hypothetical protein
MVETDRLFFNGLNEIGNSKNNIIFYQFSGRQTGMCETIIVSVTV